MMFVIELHKKQIKWFKNKFGITDYVIAWLAFIKGLIFGIIITYYFLN